MKIGHVEIHVQQYADGRWGFDDYSLGQRNRVRCRTKQKADARATDLAVFIANGRNDLLHIDQNELAQFRRWKAACNASPLLCDAVSQFITLKTLKSSRHAKSLANDLKIFESFIGPTQPIGMINALDIQRFLSSRACGERRKFNLRAEIIALFRWARRMSYLDCERTTEAEKVEPIEKVPGKPNVLSPDQLRVMLDNVLEVYLPWLAIGAFAGIRTEEIAPDRKSKKAPLKWEDFDWKHKVIIVRAETAKTKDEREVPILPNLAQWLTPWRNSKGPILGGARQPSDRETARLGSFIGGWKHNCLRDSFCSYRARITQNVPQVSYEMGNSIAMVKRSYHRRQPIRAAREWFNIRPAKSTNVVRFTRPPDQKVPNSARLATSLGTISGQK